MKKKHQKEKMTRKTICFAHYAKPNFRRKKKHKIKSSSYKRLL